MRRMMCGMAVLLTFAASTLYADDGDLIVNGKVGVGTTSPAVKLHVADNTAIKVGAAYISSGGSAWAHYGLNEWFDGTSWHTSGSPGALFQQAGQVTTWYIHDGQGAHTWIMILDAQGNLTARAYYSYSDLRLKKDVIPVAKALEKLQGLTAYYYYGIKDGDNERQIGLIAQEVQTVLPELVKTDENGYKAVNYGHLSAVLVQAINEIKAENDSLKNEITKIKQKLGL